MPISQNNVIDASPINAGLAARKRTSAFVAGALGFAVVCALVAAALAAAAPGSADSARNCKGKQPIALKLSRSGGLRGRLSWRPPANRPAASRYRVYRNRAVVGQTTRRSMRVRIKPRRRNTFSVGVVSASGRVSRCRAVLQRVMSLRSPTPPSKLAVRRVTETGASLHWLRARAGDAPLAGYRIYRDGRTVRQVKSRSARVRLSSGVRYSFRVAAVDRGGMVGPPSNSVVIRTKHRGPGAPGLLTASGVTDTTVNLGWTTARQGSRHIAGYRVFRDGVALYQLPALATQVSNLAPATAYRFTVAAVDGLGYMSAPSRVASATTAMPPPTQGYAHAFLLATTDQSFADLRAHYMQIGTVYPTYFDCLRNASIVGKDDPLVTRWAQLRRIAVMPRFNCQNDQTLTQILTNSATRARTLDTMLGLVDTYGYDGINLDFENGNDSIRSPLTSFVSTLAARLHARGKKLSVDVSAKRFDNQAGRPAFYDYRGLSAAADYIFVMNWGLHWSVSAPGALDDLPWATAVADYVASMPNKRRFVLGTPMYGFDWPNGGGTSNPATAREYSEIMALASATGATPQLDPTVSAWHFTYRDGGGVRHDVWYADRVTVRERIRLARQRGLGIGFWRLGTEDQRIWESQGIQPGIAWP